MPPVLHVNVYICASLMLETHAMLYGCTLWSVVCCVYTGTSSCELCTMQLLCGYYELLPDE